MAVQPGTLRDDAVRALDLTVKKMSSATFMLALRSATPAQRAAAGGAIIDAGLARQELRRARLEEIAALLEAQEEPLKKATEELGAAVEDLKQVKAVLDGVAALLKVVGRVVALA
jgi:hypothetical protein